MHSKLIPRTKKLDYHLKEIEWKENECRGWFCDEEKFSWYDYEWINVYVLIWYGVWEKTYFACIDWKC